jgi:hypothetical protein
MHYTTADFQVLWEAAWDWCAAISGGTLTALEHGSSGAEAGCSFAGSIQTPKLGEATLWT